MKKYLTVVVAMSLLSFGWAQPPSLKAFSETFTEVVREVSPAVVTITSQKVVKREGGRFRHPFEDLFPDDFFRFYFDLPEGEMKTPVLGSGVIVDAENGYVLTNNHVVEGAAEITVLLMDEREYAAEIVGTDSPSDVAVLRIEADDLKGVRFGDSDRLEVGEWVLAIGSPFNENLSHTVTAGIVSAKGRSQVLGGIDYQDFIQTDAAINPGNSGGALVNLDGELVGINTAIATAGGFSRGNVGVGFAIPVNLAKTIMSDLINEGRVIRAWLGVWIQDVDDGIAKALDLPDREGVLVNRVIEESPAEKAGIDVEDVIVELEGTKVRDTAHLKNLVSTTRPGTRVKIKIARKGETRTFRVRLDEYPEEEAVLATRGTVSPELGLGVEDVTSSYIREFDLGKDISGVVVVEVSPTSAAARAGIRPGDLITRVGDKEISSAREFRRAIREKEKGDTILFLVHRRGMGSIFIPIEN